MKTSRKSKWILCSTSQLKFVAQKLSQASKNEELDIEYQDEAKEAELSARAELAESLIFPVEQARANKEKFHTLKCELAQLSQLIKDASKVGKSSIAFHLI